MAKKAKKGNGKAKVAAKPAPAKQDAAKAKPARQAPDLDALRKPVVAARAKFEAISDEAKEQVKKAVDSMSQSAREYHQALAPYREACRKAGVECEFEGGRSENVSPKVSFIVEKTEKGIRVAVKGKPGSEEVIPLAALKASIGKVAYAYTEKHVGPREKVGNKGGTLANRLRVVMGGKK
jgi:hypothetical protein